MPWETEETKEFDAWFDGLDQADKEHVIAAQMYLEDVGPAVRMPMSYPIKQSNECGMRELRPASKGRSEIRILYAFDYRRTGILLLGGDKAAIPGDWDAWYDRNVPVADRRFAAHVAGTRSKEVSQPGKSKQSKGARGRRKH